MRIHLSTEQEKALRELLRKYIMEYGKPLSGTLFQNNELIKILAKLLERE